MNRDALLLTCKQIEHEARPFSDGVQQFSIQIFGTKRKSLTPLPAEPPGWFKRIRWLRDLVLVFEQPGDVDWTMDQLHLILKAFDGSREFAECSVETACTRGWSHNFSGGNKNYLEIGIALAKRMQAIERPVDLSVAETSLYSMSWIETKHAICRGSDQQNADEVLRQCLGDEFNEKWLASATA